jgi:hypothetical protein
MESTQAVLCENENRATGADLYLPLDAKAPLTSTSGVVANRWILLNLADVPPEPVMPHARMGGGKKEKKSCVIFCFVFCDTLITSGGAAATSHVVFRCVGRPPRTRILLPPRVSTHPLIPPTDSPPACTRAALRRLSRLV